MKKSLMQVLMGSIAVSMMAFSVAAFAEATEEDINRFVKNCDVDKDGMISKSELLKRATATFDKMDSGKKGMMDDMLFMNFLLELKKTDGYTSSGRMMSKADLMNKIETMFDKVDTGKKGMLNRKQAEHFLRELTKSGA